MLPSITKAHPSAMTSSKCTYTPALARSQPSFLRLFDTVPSLCGTVPFSTEPRDLFVDLDARGAGVKVPPPPFPLFSSISGSIECTLSPLILFFGSVVAVSSPHAVLFCCQNRNSEQD
jgi:hypothetical protein